MSHFVIDASVAAKWVLPEAGEGDARAILARAEALHAPALLPLELDSLLTRRVRRREISAAEAGRDRAALAAIPMILHDMTILRAAAWRIALETGQTIYDCLYVALAVDIGAPLITADQRLANGLRASPYGGLVRLLGAAA